MNRVDRNGDQSADLELAARSRRRARPAAGWSAVFALTLCVSTLIASEFMPVSILTPIATDLHLTEGAAGQAISISGLFAVLTSLSIAPRDARARSPHACCSA